MTAGIFAKVFLQEHFHAQNCTYKYKDVHTNAGKRIDDAKTET
jgi:hypothetical protein